MKTKNICPLIHNICKIQIVIFNLELIVLFNDSIVDQTQHCAVETSEYITALHVVVVEVVDMTRLRSFPAFQACQIELCSLMVVSLITQCQEGRQIFPPSLSGPRTHLPILLLLNNINWHENSLIKSILPIQEPNFFLTFFKSINLDFDNLVRG